MTSLDLDRSVRLPGFRQYDELPAYYGLAEAFVHASRTEQWGLVVNEAMASGLPVLVSRQCGCAPELVAHGTNGYQFDPNDQVALARCMAEITRDEEHRQMMGQASSRAHPRMGAGPLCKRDSSGGRSAHCAGPPRRRLMDNLILQFLTARGA